MNNEGQISLEDTLELCRISESDNIRELLQEFIVVRGFNENLELN